MKEPYPLWTRLNIGWVYTMLGDNLPDYNRLNRE
jgi:hypothetical protein